jgi:hypothetical protein
MALNRRPKVQSNLADVIKTGFLLGPVGPRVVSSGGGARGPLGRGLKSIPLWWYIKCSSVMYLNIIIWLNLYPAKVSPPGSGIFAAFCTQSSDTSAPELKLKVLP